MMWLQKGGKIRQLVPKKEPRSLWPDLLTKTPLYAFPAPGQNKKNDFLGGGGVRILFWEFFFYSFCGFLFEITFARVVGHPKRDRKCHLILPVCPVYGVGALMVLALPEAVKGSPLLLFFAGALICTVAEWGLSLFYEKAAGAAFWDYSALPWNLAGRVCLPFSLFWGALCLPLVYVVQPWVLGWASAAPAAATIPAALFYLGDAATSLLLLRRLGTQGLRWYTRFTPSEAR